MSRDLLGDFCRWLVDRGASNRRLHPASVALAFVDHFGLSSFPRMEEITTLLDRAGVGTAVSSNLPHSFRGFHNVTKDGGFLIQYEASEWNGAQEHTVLHETYEILRKRLHDLHPAIGIPQGKRLCREADRFAASVLMQPEMFALFAESTGLDVVALQKMYQRSYASLTLRLAEVMRHQPLMAVLYEREEDGPPHLWDEAPAPSQFITKIVARTPGFRLRTQKRPLSCLRGLLPRRGAPPAQGSVAERVVQTGRPVHMERVSGYDLCAGRRHHRRRKARLLAGTARQGGPHRRALPGPLRPLASARPGFLRPTPRGSSGDLRIGRTNGQRSAASLTGTGWMDDDTSKTE